MKRQYEKGKRKMNLLLMEVNKLASLKEIKRLLSYTVSVEPLWGDDTGREAMDGHYSGTFIGYFTKIELIIGKTTQEEMTYNKNILEHPLINLTYPSEKTGQDITEEFYGTAIQAKKNNYKGKYDGFTISLVGTVRRG